MNYTSNYNLKLPERNEQFNIDDWNSNTTAIDSQMKTNATNIATNATNIATIFTGLNTKNVSDTNSVYYKLMKLIYPVGSIYWSNNSANPSTLFGGTWTQIKDKFVWAKGDSDTVGATGGAKTVTLTVNNLPSHNHSFTPQGSVSVTTNPTFSGSAVTSGTNSRGHTHSYSHTHGYTPSGNLVNDDNAYNNRTGEMSGNSTGKFFTAIGATGNRFSDSTRETVYANAYSGVFTPSKYTAYTAGDFETASLRHGGTQVSMDIQHTHNVYFSGTAGTTTSQSSSTSGEESQNHTHSVTASGTISGGAYSFSGTAGTTGNTGSGTAVDKMPPYVVKYCWERTA